jgi:hypothetical protein
MNSFGSHLIHLQANQSQIKAQSIAETSTRKISNGKHRWIHHQGDAIGWSPSYPSESKMLHASFLSAWRQFQQSVGKYHLCCQVQT